MIAGRIAKAFAGALIMLVGAGCSSPDLGNTTFACTTDADCLGGKVCSVVHGQKACIAAPRGDIRLGMSAAFSGTSGDLGTQLRRGVLAYFKKVNDSGGISGRHVALDSLDDHYDPTAAHDNMVELLDIQQEIPGMDQPDIRGPNSVLAILGNVGTPTMLVTAPMCMKNKVIFFAPFTGAQKYLRDGTDSPYVFNYRAGYYEETAAMVEYLFQQRAPRIPSYKNVVAFTQNDSYGDTGYAGFVAAYKARTDVPQLPSDTAIERVQYDRDNLTSVNPAIASAETYLAQLMVDTPTTPPNKLPVGIFMIDTYKPGDTFIRGIKDWINTPGTPDNRAAILDVTFIHVSFVGGDSLRLELANAPNTYTDANTGEQKTYGAGVMVTEVVPYYLSEATGVQEYRAEIDRFDQLGYNFTSLEGHIAARLFVEGLRRAGAAPSTDELVKAYESIANLDLGIGTLLGFSSTDHQASHTVWISTITDDGTAFSVPNKVVGGVWQAN